MRLSQSLAKSYFCILDFFKQIGLEKAMIAFSLAKYRPLTAEKLLKFMFQL
jgi:hypothetical protein